MRAILLLALAVPGRADTVFLRNGGEMEGVVRSQNPAEIVLDIGYGTVTLRREDVLRISRSARADRAALEREHRLRRFEAGEEVPPAGQTLYAAYKKARSARETALEARQRSAALREAQATRESEIAALKEQYSAFARELGQVDARTQGARYNALAQSLNFTVASIQENYFKIEEGWRRLGQGQEAVQDYLASARDFRRELDARAPALRDGSDPEREFLAAMEKSQAGMRDDFARDEVVSRRQGQHLIVSALVNGRASASLLVDTGASLTMLSQQAATRLGVGASAERGTIQVSIADGSAVPARLVQLDSLQIGASRVEKVLAAVMPRPLPGLDGLLGMSFLSRFSVELDTQGGRLILNSLRPEAAPK